MNTCHACGKTMQQNEASVHITERGQVRYFCCPLCLAAFRAGLTQRKMFLQDYADDRTAILVGYLPGLQVIRDYTCIRAVGAYKVYVVVADLSGSSATPGGIMNELGARMEKSIEAGRPLTTIVQRLNEHLLSLQEKDAFLTLFAAELNFSRQVLAYISCGHPAHILWRPRSHQYVRSDSPQLPISPIASAHLLPPPVVEAPIHPSNQLIFFADGGLNQEFEAGRPAGESGIIHLFRELTESSPEKDRRGTFERIQSTRPNFPHNDLLCIFMDMKKRSPATPPLKVTAPSETATSNGVHARWKSASVVNPVQGEAK